MEGMEGLPMLSKYTGSFSKLLGCRRNWTGQGETETLIKPFQALPNMSKISLGEHEMHHLLDAHQQSTVWPTQDLEGGR